MKACVILNGEIKDYDYIKNLIKNYDYIICADGGSNHAYKMNIIPDFIIGDLDSTDEKIVKYFKEKNVNFKKFPTRKNETDTELCIYLAKTLNVSNIDFLGALGGRIDHMMANIFLLYNTKKMGMKPRIISKKEEIYLAINENLEINGNKDDIISVIAIKGDAKGVTLKNLEYSLNNYNMKYGLPLGISNIMLEDRCFVKVDDGSLLIIKTKHTSH